MRNLSTSLLLTLVSGLMSCATPIVQRADPPPLGGPSGFVAIETVTEDGVLLRGALLAADEDSPILLHLLPRGGTARGGLQPYGGFAESLDRYRAAGFTSVLFDVRGVGDSEGPVDSFAYPRDALAIWRWTQQFAEGRPLILRAVSLGSLAAASILERGGRPDGMILIAPIDAATIADRSAVHHYGGFLGPLLALFLRRPEIQDLRAALASYAGPSLLIAPSEDPYWPKADREVVRTVNPRLSWVDSDLDHFDLVLLAYGFSAAGFEGRLADGLMPAEEAFLSRFQRERRERLSGDPVPAGQGPLGRP